MIRLHTQDNVGYGRLGFLYSGVAVGSCPQVGGYLLSSTQVAATSNPSRVFRSTIDNLSTGPRKFAGDHACSNTQLSADVNVPSKVTGVATVDVDPKSSVSTAYRWCPPANGMVFSLSQCKDALSTGKSGCVYRRYSHRVGLSATAPLITDRGWAQSAICYKYGKNYRFCSTSWYARRIHQFRHTCMYAPVWIDGYLSLDLEISSSGEILNWEFSDRVAVSMFNLKPGTVNTARQSSWIQSTDTWGSYGKIVSLGSLVPSTLEAATNAISNPIYLDGLNLVPSYGTVGVLPSVTAAGDRTFYGSISAPSLYSETDEEWTNLLLKSFDRPAQPMVDWGELGDRAADATLQVSINTIAYFADLRKLLGSVRSVIDLVGNWKDPKAWASAWLSMRYGDRLTCLDSIDLIKASTKSLTSSWKKDWYRCYASEIADPIVTASGTRVATGQILKLYYKPQEYGWFSKVYLFMSQWDLWPSLQNAWDLIPLSFVVDWVVDVQSALEDLDRDIYMQYMQVLSVSESLRCYWDVPNVITVNNCTVNDVTYCSYSRNIGSHLPSAPFRVDRGHSSAINIVDGISIARMLS